MISLICDRDILAGFDKVTQFMISTHKICWRKNILLRMTNKEGWGESSTKKGRVQKRKDLINEAYREGPAPIATQIDIQMVNLEIGTSSWFDIICSGVIPFRKYSNINITN